jgi:Arm DNA-binding domain
MINRKRVRIGLREIAAMQPHSILWDTDTHGFCARRQFSEAITYSVYFRTRDGQQRFHKLERHGVLTPTQARDMAREVLINVRLGKDPAAD